MNNLMHQCFKNQAKSEMEKCSGCGVEYYAGVLSPGQQSQLM